MVIRSSTILLRLRMLAVSPPRRHTSCGLHDLSHIVAQLRHSSSHILGQNIAESPKGVELSAHELVAATHELDEFSRVNVWVAAVLDVFKEFWWNGGEVVRW